MVLGVVHGDPPLAGAIGEIVACTDCALEHLGFLDLPPWYLQKQFAGGGAALTSGIHLVDRLRWFTGGEVKAVVKEKLPV